MRSRSRGAQNGRQPPASVVLHSAPDAGFAPSTKHAKLAHRDIAPP
jgi:hypothetical protein